MDIPEEKLPRHVAIIMDGNGRWARARNLPRREGHMAGAESAKKISECCGDFGIPYLTLYAFSTENWKRPATEVKFLMQQLKKYLQDQREGFMENDIRFRAIGRIDGLPQGVIDEVRKTERVTRECESHTVNVALNYGGRPEMVDACKEIAREAKSGELDPEEITESVLSNHLYTAGMPDPDLLIRTGGEQRVSNFLLWQISYAELYFTDVLWPDFHREAFLDALRDFAVRERRFGEVKNADTSAR